MVWPESLNALVSTLAPGDGWLGPGGLPPPIEPEVEEGITSGLNPEKEYCNKYYISVEVIFLFLRVQCVPIKRLHWPSEPISYD